MGITPAVIRQKEFTTRFRGFDVQEVDSFLEDIAHELEHLGARIQSLENDNHRLEIEIQGYKKRESSLKRVMLHSQKVVEQMKANAGKQAEAVVAEAELTAEKILHKAHHRLSQLHSDITELKRQRMQIEVQVGAVIEGHSKLLEMTKEENKNADEADTALRFINQG